jgi:hypothetical protein
MGDATKIRRTSYQALWGDSSPFDFGGGVDRPVEEPRHLSAWAFVSAVVYACPALRPREVLEMPILEALSLLEGRAALFAVERPAGSAGGVQRPPAPPTGITRKTLGNGNEVITFSGTDAVRSLLAGGPIDTNRPPF